jgi:hypothetical protein
MAQVKKLQPGNVNYDTQQNAEPPAGATKKHPQSVQKIVSDAQQQLQDASGA